MSNAVADLKLELEKRVRRHRPDNPFTPTVTYDKNEHPDEVIVDYYVDLPQEERSNYNRIFFHADQSWVEQRGDDLDLTASLFCQWQV